jgi:hypothetical protein
MQLFSIISAVCTGFIILMNYHNSIEIKFLSEKFANLANTLPYSIHFDLAIYTLIIFILGVFSVVFFFGPLYFSLKDKFSAYKRELEKGSISNSNGEAKIKVLENKITVLEKALDEALKKQ